MPTSRDSPCGSVDGRWSNTSSRPSSAIELVHERGRGPPPWAQEVAEVGPGGLVVGGDQEVVAHRHLLEQLDRLPRPDDPGPRPPLHGPRVDDDAVEAHRPALLPCEAGDDVEQRRLARAVRADEPDDLAGFDGEGDLVEGDHAAEPDDDVGHLEGGGGPPGSRPHRRPSARVPARELERLGDAVHRPGPLRGDAIGRLAQHQHGAHTGQHRQPGHDVRPVGQEIGEDLGAERTGRAGRADHTGHPGDAADHRVLHEEHRADDAVLPEADVRLPHRQEHTPDGGDGGGEGEGVELGPDDADAERGGGPLVAAHRQQASTDPASADVGHHQPHEHEHHEHEPAVALGVVDGIEVEAEHRDTVDR